MIIVERVKVTMDKVTMLVGPMSPQVEEVATILSLIMGREENAVLGRLSTRRLFASLNGEEVEFAELAQLAARMECRYCGTENPFVYFGPCNGLWERTCVCFDCAKDKRWLDADGDLRPDVTL